MTTKILLVCGGGASSGFLVQNMRKYVKQKELDIFIDARSETQLASLAKSFDVVLAAPHLRFQEAKIKEICDFNNIPYGIVDPMEFGAMDGESVVNKAMNLIK